MGRDGIPPATSGRTTEIDGPPRLGVRDAAEQVLFLRRRDRSGWRVGFLFSLAGSRPGAVNSACLFSCHRLLYFHFRYCKWVHPSIKTEPSQRRQQTLLAAMIARPMTSLMILAVDAVAREKIPKLYSKPVCLRWTQWSESEPVKWRVIRKPPKICLQGRRIANEVRHFIWPLSRPRTWRRNMRCNGPLR